MSRSFDGSQHLGNTSAAITAAVPMTIAAVVRSSTTGWQTVLTNASATTTGWYWVKHSTGLYMVFTQFGGGAALSATDLALSADIWYGVTLSVASASASVAHRYRYDTHAFDTQSLGGPSFANDPAPNDVRIGRTAGSTEGFVGEIARVAWWQGLALTDEEIRAWFLGQTVRTGSLRGYWELFGQSSPEPDWSGNGYDMTVTGATVADHPPGLWVPTARRPRRVFVSSGGDVYAESPVQAWSLSPTVRDALQAIDRPGQSWVLVPFVTDSPPGGGVFEEAPAAALVVVPTVGDRATLGDSPAQAWVLLLSPPDLRTFLESPRVVAVLAPVNYPDSLIVGPDQASPAWAWLSEILVDSALDIQPGWKWRASVVDFSVTSPRTAPAKPQSRVEIN